MQSTKKLKIIHLVEDLNIGGMEYMVATLAYELRARGHAPQVWCVARGGMVADELISNNIPLAIIHITTYYNPLNVFYLAYRLKVAAVDVVHTHGYFASIIGRVAAKLAGVRVIINHVHSTYYSYRWRHLYFERLLSRITDMIICCSNAVKEFVVTHERIDLAKTVTVYNGIAPQRYAIRYDTTGLRTEFDIKDGDIVLGVVASLTRHKGHHYLLDAIARLAQKYPNLKLLIIGDGPLRSVLQKQAVDLGIMTQIIFAGIRLNVPQLLSLIDIAVLPSSEREGLGIAAIEAMAAGRPVVASRLGGIPEVVVDKETGILVTPADPASLSAALETLLANPDLRHAMGAAARQVCDRTFTAANMAKKIEDIYFTVYKQKAAHTTRHEKHTVPT